MANFYGQFIGFGSGGGAAATFHGNGTSFGYSVGGYPPVSDIIERYSFASDGDAVDTTADMNFTGGEPGGNVSSSTHGYVMIQHPTKYSAVASITKYQFNTSNDMTDVGSLSTGTSARGQMNGTMSATYGYACGGGEPTEIDVIDKWTFSSDNNATDVGDLTQERRSGSATCSSTHGYMAGGSQMPPSYNIIDKWTFASDNNATDVGDCTETKKDNTLSVQSSTHGYTGGGRDTTPNPTDRIEKYTFASDNDATDVGNLLDACSYLTGSSFTTHGYRSGGTIAVPYTDRIDKWTFAADNDATDVGNISSAGSQATGNQV